MLDKNHQLQEVQEQTENALSLAKSLTINNDSEMAGATDLLKKIKMVGKMVTEKKEAITKPLNEALKKSRDMFRPYEEHYLEAEKTVKQIMVNYQTEQEVKRKKELERVEARVEKGTMKLETAIKKIEEATEVKKTVQGEYGSVTTRKLKRIRIIDPNIIPREYLIVDMAKVQNDAIKMGIEIPGVEIYEESSISIR